ncbi:MAG: hypothetical protein KGJ07_02520 [Patescibacteria group bacterium]|nr:hypothetical protein [Patescibacteria group bacterium]MDE2590358.1 hypothetical protein [Patescibacteria group bacterium]
MKLTKEHLFIFLFSVLALTDIWIIAFQWILNFLRSSFPPQTPTGYYENLVYPKPYDIPVYILLSFSFVLLLPVIHRYLFPKLLTQYKTQENTHLFLTSASLVLAILLFLFLGNYPMANSVFPLTGNYLLYVGLISIITLGELLLFKLLQQKQWIFFTVTAIIIAILIAEPTFPVSWFDYTFILGPAYEVMHGKTIYMQASSQYGFLLTYSLALLMKIFGLGILQLPVGIWLLYAGAYASLFYVMLKTTKSGVLSILFLSALISINYYSLDHLPIAVPQIGPLRFLCLWFAPVIFYLTYFKKRAKYVGLAVMSLLSLWVIDAGIQYLLAIGSLECLLAFKKVQPLRQSVINILFTTICTGIFFALAVLIPTFFGYMLLNPSTIFQAIHEYAVSGFGMIPLPEQTFFWAFLLIFFASLMLFFVKEIIEKEDIILAFGAFLFFFASMYYVGRSHPHNIFHIAVLFLFTFFLLLSRLKKTYQLSIMGRQKAAAAILLFFYFVVVSGAFRQNTQNIWLPLYASALPQGKFFPSFQKDMTNYYLTDAHFIEKENIHKQALIISPDDTALLMLSDKSSYVNSDPMSMIISDQDLSRTIIQMPACLDKIFVAKCILSKSCTTDRTFLGTFIGEDKIYNKIQQVCGNSYKLSSCSNHICAMTR